MNRFMFGSNKYKRKDQFEMDSDEDDDKEVPVGEWWEERPSKDYFIERAKYCPLRLKLEERKFMRLIKAAIKASNYTG